MRRRGLTFAGIALLAGSAGLFMLSPSAAQDAAQISAPRAEAAEARQALEDARRLAARARERGERFEAQVAQASAASDKAQAETAALAARIQQGEAAIGLAEAEIALIRAQRRALDADLSARRQPIVRLTGALQSFVRRPLSLSLLQPSSLKETVYLSAVLDSTVPLVRERTSDLRGDILRLRELQSEAEKALATRRLNERQLAQRRRELVVIAERERIAARRAAGAANAEEARAFALAEEGRNLDALIAALGASKARAPAAATSESAQRDGPEGFRLPVDGSLVGVLEGGAKSNGIAIAPRPGAQVVAPGAGRIAFAGPYKGFGRIVIVEHDGGWTSLVTGIGDLAVVTGQQVLAGSPIGTAQRRTARIGA